MWKVMLQYWPVPQQSLRNIKVSKTAHLPYLSWCICPIAFLIIPRCGQWPLAIVGCLIIIWTGVLKDLAEYSMYIVFSFSSKPSIAMDWGSTCHFHLFLLSDAMDVVTKVVKYGFDPEFLKEPRLHEIKSFIGKNWKRHHQPQLKPNFSKVLSCSWIDI